MISVMDPPARTEGTVGMTVMEGVAVMPIPVTCPAGMCVPPTRPITPIPRTMPCAPVRTPKPIVYYRTVNIYRLDDVVRSIYIFVAYYLYLYLLLLVFLYVDRGYVLEDIFREDSL
jgi:hypothetical protein